VARWIVKPADGPLDEVCASIDSLWSGPTLPSADGERLMDA
jgi:hypothetical protein